MVWKRAQKSPARKLADQVRFRPNVLSLEDRLLLTLTTFYVDDTQSALTVSGNVSGIALAQQGPGSLTAAYTGAFVADIDYSPGYPNAITFYNGGNDVSAENSGNWLPDTNNNNNPAPANYGGQISFLGTGYAAVRNVNVGSSSDPNNPLPLSGLGDGVSYAFPNNETLTINSGIGNFNHPLGHGSFDLSNHSASNQADQDGNGSYLFDYNGDGSFLALYVSVDIQLQGTLSGFDYTLNIDGAITAYGSLGYGPAARGGHHGNNVALGTSLLAGSHSGGQALLSSSLGSLDNADPLAMQQLTLANSASQSHSGTLGTADTLAHHQATTDHVDAVFVEMSPIENMTI